MDDLYRGREQSGIKHRLVETYLQKLAYKILILQRNRSLAYVDAFSGPWESKSTKFADTSFARALATLKRVQQDTLRSKGFRPVIKGVFVERDTNSFAQLKQFVLENHDPKNSVMLTALSGEFEAHVERIASISADSFRLTFIDPTGWTGYSFDRISPLLKGRNSETIINFMYDHVNRFVQDGRASIQESFFPILGGDIEQWLEKHEDREAAIISRFSENFRAASDYKHIISTPISKPRSDRTHFILAFGTNSLDGMTEFRAAERDAQHHYAAVKAKLREERTDQGQTRLFDTAAMTADYEMERSLEQLKAAAQSYVLDVFLRSKAQVTFRELAGELLERFPLRLTEIKRVCTALAEAGLIEASWKRRGSRKQVPDFDDPIVPLS